MEQKRKIVIGIGGLHVDEAPCSIVTCLGSCIAVCLHSPSRKVGGMVHVAMPDSAKALSQDNLQEGKYADTAIVELMRRLKRDYQVTNRHLVAKIFGGAKILKQVKDNIGEQNKMAVVHALDQSRIDMIASQTGGDKGYRVEFDLDSGKVLCQSIGEQPKEY